VTIPDWYNINNGAKQAYMYSEEAIDKCSSDHLTISSSNFFVGNLRITFEAVKPGYESGKTITFSCQGFKNPIYPDFWNGFRIQVFDMNKYQITYTTWQKLIFDATAFTPVMLAPENFKITVGNPIVGSYSPWIFNLDVSTPLEQVCFIKVLLPTDIAYDFQAALATKIFRSSRGTDVLL